MLKGEDFDVAAEKYDDTFVNSAIGMLQRKRVYKYISKVNFKKQKSNNKYCDSGNLLRGLKVLELNCGTGEDAVWLSEQGCEVLATDISEKMLEVAREKAKNKSASIIFQRLDFNEFETNDLPESYDLIFSNFGGLNCIDEDTLAELFKKTSHLLSKNGKLIMVIMPKFCGMESLFFSLKLSFKKALRRLTDNYVIANVDGVEVKTWYYAPLDIKRLSNSLFTVENLKPIGIFLPPSYLESFFKRNQWLLFVLSKLENLFGNISFLAQASDHFYIELQKSKKV